MTKLPLHGFLLLLLTHLAAAFASPVLAAPLDIRLQQKLENSDPSAEFAVVVTFRDNLDLSAQRSGPSRSRRADLIHALKRQAKTVQQPLREFLRNRGNPRVTEFWINNSLLLDASPALIRELALRPEVAGVRLQEFIRLPRATPAQVTGPAEPNVNQVNAPALWAKGFAGQGVTVAIMDSGVDVNHPDLGPRWRGGNNSWFDPNGEHPLLPFDSEGHGTEVMGVLVGGNASGQVIGVAPEAQWIAVKIFNDAGEASETAIHQGFQWLLNPDGNPDTDDAPDVVNNSWGFEDSPGVCNANVQAFRPDVQALKAAGIATVFSAGNTGPAANTSVAPANYPEAFAVGSIGTFLSPAEISGFSARGASACDGSFFPELVAPGFVVKTTDLTLGGVFPASYVFVTGSSIAAPHVAGVMALLLSADPALAVGDLEQALLASATDFGNPGPDNAYGHGLVNALAAYDRVFLPPQLEIVDEVPPADDARVDFGRLQVGLRASQNITLRNAGRETLTMNGLDLQELAAPFSIELDGCSGIALAGGETCGLQVGFAPVAAGSFQGSFLIYSNDINSPSQVFAAGEGTELSPPPQLVISEDSGARDDATIEFDQVLPGATAFASIVVSNASGAGPLQIHGLGVASLTEPFAVAADTCSGSTLLAGQDCVIQAKFTPPAAASFTGRLQIFSNDAASPHAIDIHGTGNTPPPPARLQWPVNGGTNLPTSLTLSWSQQPDADGDQVTNTVQLSTDPHFFSPVEVTASSGAPGLLLASLQVAVCLLPFGASRGRKGWLILLTICCGTGLLMQISCGDGDSSGQTVPPDFTRRSQTVSNLGAGTTYYWRVLSADSRGGASGSEVFSFTTGS